MGNIELRIQDATILKSENDDKLNNRGIKTRVITVTKKQVIIRPSAEKKVTQRQSCCIKMNKKKTCLPSCR